MAMTIKSKKHAKSAWRVKTDIKEKRWGKEGHWAALPSIHGKILYIDAGESTSFKYYPLKNESLYILSGKVEITYGNEMSIEDAVQHPFEKGIFVAGDGINIQSCCPYMIRAIEDSKVLEIGDNHSELKVKVPDISI